jgi:hypothetical protein
MDVVGWKRQEVGLKQACRLSAVGLFGFYAVLRIRIHMFLGLLDPDPNLLVRCMDPDPDPSITKQK